MKTRIKRDQTNKKVRALGWLLRYLSTEIVELAAELTCQFRKDYHCCTNIGVNIS